MNEEMEFYSLAPNLTEFEETQFDLEIENFFNKKENIIEQEVTH